jgi:multidrug resistance efflux pump
MEILQQQINEKNADILEAKAYLYETDWEVIKSTELKYTLNAEVSQKRAESRELINIREAEIASMQAELDAQAKEGFDPIPY